MKALKVFIKLFEAPRRSVKMKIQVIFYFNITLILIQLYLILIKKIIFKFNTDMETFWYIKIPAVEIMRALDLSWIRNSNDNRRI